MLLDLQPLDVDESHGKGADEDDGEDTDQNLVLWVPPKARAGDHEGAGHADQSEEQDGVAVDTVDEDGPCGGWTGRNWKQTRKAAGRTVPRCRMMPIRS